MKRALTVMVVLMVGIIGAYGAPAVKSVGGGMVKTNARIILLHGMGRSHRSMATMARHLAERGFQVINVDYPSTEASVEALTAGIVADAVQACRTTDPKAPIHFVTHSLGGILVRQYLQTKRLPPDSRVVMLSPPNQGSEIADLLKNWLPYRWMMGPAGQQLGTTADDIPHQLQPVDVPVGIITGDRSLEPWFSSQLPGPDDGKVSVARARLPEMADFMVVHKSHGFIMNDPTVIAQTIHFLMHGRFKSNVTD